LTDWAVDTFIAGKIAQSGQPPKLAMSAKPDWVPERWPRRVYQTLGVDAAPESALEWLRSRANAVHPHHPEARMIISRTWISIFLVSGVLAVSTLGPSGTAGAGETEMRMTAAVGDQGGHGDKININTADVKELMKLAGVHKKTAEKIVEYRQAHGLFKKPEEVVKVEGIGHALFEKNRTRIVIE